jgi:hypothetical protein
MDVFKWILWKLYVVEQKPAEIQLRNYLVIKLIAWNSITELSSNKVE